MIDFQLYLLDKVELHAQELKTTALEKLHRLRLIQNAYDTESELIYWSSRVELCIDFLTYIKTLRGR